MSKKSLVLLMEWLRPVGIGCAIFSGYSNSTDAISLFHEMGPFVTVIMCGTVSFESLFLGGAASEKIGYQPNRAYQVQSGLANAAIAITALLVYFLEWGRFADATIVTVMLLFFAFSAANHAVTAVREKNLKFVNLMRPVMTLLLIGFLLPPLISSLSQ